jgi:hypothetical protein
VALWLPNVVLGGLGAYLFAGAATERLETTGGVLREGYGWLASRVGRRLERVV